MPLNAVSVKSYRFGVAVLVRIAVEHLSLYSRKFGILAIIYQLFPNYFNEIKIDL